MIRKLILSAALMVAAAACDPAAGTITPAGSVAPGGPRLDGTTDTTAAGPGTSCVRPTSPDQPPPDSTVCRGLIGSGS